MRRKRLAATAAATAIATLSGCATTDHAAAPVTHAAITHAALTPHAAITPRAATHKAAPAPDPTTTAPADPAVLWLASAGGQAQVTFNQEVDTLAGDLETESHAPTVANHLIFEAGARTVRAQAQKILSTPSLLPTVNRAAYEQMLHSFITVADMHHQPGLHRLVDRPQRLQHRRLLTAREPGAHRTTSGPARENPGRPAAFSLNGGDARREADSGIPRGTHDHGTHPARAHFQ
jgi:hypothetical protein